MDDGTQVAAAWNGIRMVAISHAKLLANTCGARFAELIEREAQRLSSLPPPCDLAQSRERQMLSAFLGSKLGSIASASLSAQVHPQAADTILKGTVEFCDRVPCDENILQESARFLGWLTQVGCNELSRAVHKNANSSDGLR